MSKSFLLHSDELAQLQCFAEQGPEWLEQFRKAGLARVQQMHFPTIRDEDWRYTNMAEALQQRYCLAEASLPLSSEINSFRLPGAAEIVFVNGIFSKALSELSMLPTGITIRRWSAMAGAEVQAYLSKPVSAETDVFVALNQALFQDGVCIDVAKAATAPLVHIIHLTTKASLPVVTLPRHLLRVAEQAEASLVESYVSLGDSAYLTAAVVDVELAARARMHHAKIQCEALQATHVGSTRFWQGAGSYLNTFSLALGAKLGRNQLAIYLNGLEAQVILSGLYACKHQQLIDNHSLVVHAAPSCRSRQLYKGILSGKSRAVFNGKVLVPQDSQQTDGYQINRNILLSKEARVYTKPELEIYANDVKCTHGATVGQLRDDELFYFQSRGIGRQRATQMLIHGFVADVLSSVEHDGIRQHVQQRLKDVYATL